MAHRGWVDKKRREINLSGRYEVKNVLPEHFQEDYPKLVTFLEKYYDYLLEDSDTQHSVDLLKHLYEKKDIIATDLDLLEFIEDELLLGQSYFQGFSNPRAASEFSSTLYRSKGSKFSIEQFFRMFYQEDPDVVYGKDLIFKLNDSASEIGAASDKRITNNTLYQVFAILIKIGIPVSSWESVYKLFVHPAGMYLQGLVQIVGEADLDVDDQDAVIPAPPTPISLVGEGIVDAFALGELSQLQPNDSGNDMYRTNPRYMLDSTGLAEFQNATIEQLAKQYSSLTEIIETNSPTFDEDSDGTTIGYYDNDSAEIIGSGIGFSNTIETMDQERSLGWDPDSDDYVASLPKN